MAIYALKVVHKGTLLGQEIRNIYWFQYYCPSGAPNPTVMIPNYFSAIYSPLGLALSNSLVFSSYEWYWSTQDVGTLLVFGGEVAHSTVFTNTADFEPTQIAAVLIGKVLGRRGFGRKFIAGICEDGVLSGLITSTLLSYLASAVSGYINVISDYPETLTPGVGKKDKVTGTYHVYPFTSGLIGNILGTMRRRKIGVGA